MADSTSANTDRAYLQRTSSLASSQEDSSTRNSCEAPNTPFSATQSSGHTSANTASHPNTTTSARTTYGQPTPPSTPPPYGEPEMPRRRYRLEERKRDYSMWLSRMMGNQLVRGLNSNKGKGDVPS